MTAPSLSLRPSATVQLIIACLALCLAVPGIAEAKRKYPYKAFASQMKRHAKFHNKRADDLQKEQEATPPGAEFSSLQRKMDALRGEAYEESRLAKKVAKLNPNRKPPKRFYKKLAQRAKELTRTSRQLIGIGPRSKEWVSSQAKVDKRVLHLLPLAIKHSV